MKKLTPLFFSACAMTAAMTLTSCGSARHGVSHRGHRGKPRTEMQANVNVPSTQTPMAVKGVAKAVVDDARSWIGTPYAYGGKTRDGADCSGFVMAVFGEAAGIAMPRSTRDQREFCKEIDPDKAKPGDLLFFTSKGSSGKTAHVGLFVGNGQMIHASSSRGVVADALSQDYWREHLAGAGRVPGMKD